MQNACVNAVQPHPAPGSNRSDSGQVRQLKPAVIQALRSNTKTRMRTMRMRMMPTFWLKGHFSRASHFPLITTKKRERWVPRPVPSPFR